MAFTPIADGTPNWDDPLNAALIAIDDIAVNAEAAAGTAQTTAETAQATAATAQLTADDAVADAGTAQSAATAAQGTADQALSGLTSVNRTIDIPNSGTDSWITVNIPADVNTPSGPNRLQVWHGGARTFGLNEYGEARFRPGNDNTVAARVFSAVGGSTGDVFQFVDSTNTVVRFRMSDTEIESVIRFVVDELGLQGHNIYATDGTDPGAAPDGSFWFKPV